jgi:hypothetical protein
MTKLLEEAFAQISSLSENEQDAIAEWLLETLASERRWSEAFAASHDVLESLAEEALNEYRKGHTQVLDPGKTVNSRTTERFRRELTRLLVQVRRQAREAYRLFRDNPYHPSLWFKQVHPTRPMYSVRISIDYRAVDISEVNEIVWFWVGSHADYEQLISRMQIADYKCSWIPLACNDRFI